MLYDKRWDKTEIRAKPPVLSVAGLAAWLETQDPTTTYNYSNIDRCLLSQYFQASGYRWAFCGVTKFTYRPFFILIAWKKIPPEMDDIAACGRRTFGAALERARAALSSCKGD